MKRIALEDASIQGQNAKLFLDNPIFKRIMSLLKESIEDEALSTKTTDKEACADIIRLKILLAGLERGIYKLINDGKIAQRELLGMKTETTIEKIRKIVR